MFLQKIPAGYERQRDRVEMPTAAARKFAGVYLQVTAGRR
jgi:hypothetical protein